MAEESVLITGGAGFIGRALVGVCLAHGRRVGVYDNLRNGRAEHLVPYRESIAFFESDIRDGTALDCAFETFRPDSVIHLAALHFIPYCNTHPAETLDVNVTGTYLLLDTCARHGVRNVVFASSGALYPGKARPLEEDQDVPTPEDVYGLSKLLGEQTCRHFVATGGLSCRVARLFNTYGPFETNPHVLPTILQQLHSGNTLELGNLHSKRDYIYVEDTAEALYSLCLLEQVGFDVYNVGTGQEYSVQELVDLIAKLTGRRLNVVQSTTRIRKTDKHHQIANRSKVYARTGFKARIGIEEGLQKLLLADGLL